MSFAKIRESIYRRADGGRVGGKCGSEPAIATPPRQQSQRVSKAVAKRPPRKGADLQGAGTKFRADRKRRGVVRARKGYEDGGDVPDLSPDDIASMTHYSEAPNPAAPYMKALRDFARRVYVSLPRLLLLRRRNRTRRSGLLAGLSLGIRTVSLGGYRRTSVEGTCSCIPTS
jgi:hypothetical protein